MRQRYEDLPAAEWSTEEALHHLTGTFDRACRSWPDVMEPYVVQFAEAAEAAEADRKEVMRRGLRETINKRYPGAHHA